MSAAIANSFIFRESYFAEEVLQFQTPSTIGEDEDNSACGLDYIRKYVEQLTADAKLTAAPSLHSTSTSTTTSSTSTSALSASSSPNTAPTTTTTTTAAHAAIKAFDFASIQVSPSASSSTAANSPHISSSSSSSNNDATPSPFSVSQLEDGSTRPENDFDLPRYLSWFDDEALASECDSDGDDEDDDSVSDADDMEQEDVIFYDEENDEIHDAEMDEEPLFIGQQAQLQIYEVTKKYKQTLSPDCSLSTSPSTWSTALSFLAQNCALPIDCDTFKRKGCDSVPEPEKNPSKKIKRWTQQ